ncbi:MAG TPA: hypothetical protein RMH85_33210 [Polyangiaceae bacterium LLY-WYZ-15_(1-7)]|nr:hypothetical protein [Myxococcales bacterium]MAT25113.1 hypothetical protein [Sandaracinus sp.]HJL01914.1 hypothetical protein [Polyangiaceae bacterium LLY-WYZ-15_(1-7)]MBJ70562.1 hypothetical protein [Sandaracinus sp.]HJL13389.1 hypothetical protein [Polyangiaceae bacterium LLY-WYZ-15_(1-7)]
MRAPLPVLCLLLACSDPSARPDAGAAPDAGVDAAPEPEDTGPPIPGAQTLSTTLPDMPLEAGEEDASLCFSWTLDNATEVFVNTVRMEATRGIHHSNWFFVRPNVFQGEDGLWKCRDRGFDSVAAATSGGVLFAQSTQAAGEEQRFPDRTALRLPPLTRIVGQIHLLNTSPEPTTVEAAMHLDTLPVDAVETRLHGLAFDYLDLQIPPRMQSEFAMECDFAEQNGGPLDFRIYYALPHYHELGLGLRVELIGGPRDGEILWESFTPIGEPLGETFDPPLEVDGATGMRVTCVYDNPRDEVVRYGIGTQEMCLMLAFTDSRYIWGGGNLERGGNVEVAREEGVSYNEAPCRMVRYTP